VGRKTPAPIGRGAAVRSAPAGSGRGVARVLIAGLEGRGLLIEAPLLQRAGCDVSAFDTPQELVRELREQSAQLLVLGTLLDGIDLPDLIHRIRAAPDLRRISILSLLPVAAPPHSEEELRRAGANAVLRRPLDRARLEAWIAKLLTVARRVEVRIPVDGQVLGSPRRLAGGHFFGQARNVSMHGLLLASPLRLVDGADLDLDLRLLASRGAVKALARVVRSAEEVRWPYLGYGVEFLCLPDESHDVLANVVDRRAHDNGSAGGIHSTLHRGQWVYEIRSPAPAIDGWHVEIRRAPQDSWHPGSAGPFFVVGASTPNEALREARDFLARHG
jgi:CheY-like chemotaxis protein